MFFNIIVVSTSSLPDFCHFSRSPRHLDPRRPGMLTLILQVSEVMGFFVASHRIHGNGIKGYMNGSVFSGEIYGFYVGFCIPIPVP